MMDCPLCRLDGSSVFHHEDLVIGLWDPDPVTPWHALVAPRRHIATWFDASPEERLALMLAVDRARDSICAKTHPDGFNIGVDVGPSAGQSLMHLHVHVIPRFGGDAPGQRGGMRRVVVPSTGRSPSGGLIPELTQTPHDRPLVRGHEDDPLLPHLLANLDRAIATDIAVAFTLRRGVALIVGHLQDLLDRGGKVRFLTGDYRDVTDPVALMCMLDLRGRAEARVFEARTRSFHPKTYILRFADGTGVAYVGSSNLSETALLTGVEWNFRTITTNDVFGFEDISAAFDRLYCHGATRPLDEEWVLNYQRRRTEPLAVAAADIEVEPPADLPEPHPVQVKALAKLRQTREEGNSAGLVVLATGLGKTWLSAFDSSAQDFSRVLFVAHREEILAQARATFRCIRPNARLGYYTGDEKQLDSDVLFASIQTLGKARHFRQFAPDAFDYIIVDEFHHAAARTYRSLIDYFSAKFLLGLTATPERTDGGDLLGLCQENLVFRCDLVEGIRLDLLCPFQYFGVPDDVDYANIPWRNSRFDEKALTEAVATQARAKNALEQFRQRAGRRTLAFCCSQRHADFMAEYFSAAGVRSVAVH